jgi:hypothetical protein
VDGFPEARLPDKTLVFPNLDFIKNGRGFLLDHYQDADLIATTYNPNPAVGSW